jgi:hypothetical protein
MKINEYWSGEIKQKKKIIRTNESPILGKPLRWRGQVLIADRIK